MGKGHLRFDFADVDLHDLGIGGIGVGVVKGIGPPGTGFHVGLGYIIGNKDAVLASRFNGHVGNGKPIRHGQRADCVSRKFHGFVKSAVDTDPADNIEDQVLTRNPGIELAGENKFDRFGNLEPDFAGQHGRCQIRAAHTGGKCPQRPVGAGVAVRADHKVSRQDNALFRQQGVLHADFPDLVIVGDLLLPGKVAHDLALGGGADVLVGGEMVRDKDHLVPVKDFLPSSLAEFVDGQRGRDIVSQGDIHLCIDQHSGTDFVQIGMPAKDLFRNGHSHDFSLPLKDFDFNAGSKMMREAAKKATQ
ncbi:MAG: hypothetical protein A4E66_01294 [Syntrophus sp. PtaB.Bin001]|nr:MAG: hypothetical protein A4E66_01294 [Syntrophus sp. PtaB.Bin001]